MSGIVKHSLMLIVALSAVIGLIFFFCQEDKVDLPDGDGDSSSKTITIKTVNGVKRKIVDGKKFRHRSVKLDKDLKPELQLDEEDESKLSSFCKKVLTQVQEALDKDDLKTLVIVLEKIKVKIVEARKNGVDVNSVVPELVRVRAIEACGWFGAEALPEILDGMTDESPKVREMSAEEFQSAIGDETFGDYDRAELVKAAAKVLNDTDALDSIFMSINDMRNSVIADTVTSILNTGTPEAKALMKEQIGFFTDGDVESVNDIPNWLSENPDDPEDDDFYGPQESNDKAADK